MPLSLAFAFLAGLLTILSPCVLPILPVVFGAAAGQHRFGPAALALGVASAFAGAGILLATVGFSAGLDADALRPFASGLLILFGLALLVPVLRHATERALAPVAGLASRRMERIAGSGLLGQLGLGAMLGLVWSPCVGPTLGAASVLAAQGHQLGGVALVMLLFGLGAAIPLLAIGLLSRAALMRTRGRLIAGGAWGRRILGAGLLLVGVVVLAGLDHRLEAILLQLSPDWLTGLTTRF